MTFWFDEAGPKRWYRKSDAFDAEIRQRFEETGVRLAADSKGWRETPDHMLALIIALDQFPRNMYRGNKASFAWDEKARNIASMMIEKGWDLKIDQSRRAFVYMPFMHGETMKAQNECVRLCDSRLDDSSSLHHAKEHRKLIKRFGRFPHRNEILGRDSTAEEKNFLKDGGYAP